MQVSPISIAFPMKIDSHSSIPVRLPVPRWPFEGCSCYAVRQAIGSFRPFIGFFRNDAHLEPFAVSNLSSIVSKCFRLRFSNDRRSSAVHV